jgi:hypothetical protein
MPWFDAPHPPAPFTRHFMTMCNTYEVPQNENWWISAPDHLLLVWFAPFILSSIYDKNIIITHSLYGYTFSLQHLNKLVSNSFFTHHKWEDILPIATNNTWHEIINANYIPFLILICPPNGYQVTTDWRKYIMVKFIICTLHLLLNER